MNCLDSKISWNKSFFNLHDRESPGRHVNAESRKRLEIQAYFIIPWVPGAYGFGQVLKSDPREKVPEVFSRGFAAHVFGLRPNECRPTAEETKL